MSSDNPISYRCSQLSNYDLSAACSSVNRYYYDAAPFLLSKPANPTSKMLHKTGFRFKRLMSPRKNQPSEGGMSSPIEPSSNSKQNQYQNPTESQPSKLRVKSWVSRPSVENEQFSQDENQPGKSTSSTAHSSSSSLCSCDNTVACAGPHSLSKSAAPAQAPSSPPKTAHSDPQTSTSPEIPPLDAAASTSFQGDGDARTWRLILSDLATQTPLLPFRKSTDKTEEKRPHNSTFNLLEALSIDPVSDNERTPTPSLNLSPKSQQDSISSLMNLSPTSISSTTPTEIETLARQTDEAFRAVGHALEEAKASTQLFTMASSSSASPAPLLQMKKQRKAPIARTKSRAKRTKSSRKKKVEGKREARWTMSVTEVTDNVADIFKGRIFKNDVEELIDTSKLGQSQRLSVPGSISFSTSPKQSGETARSSSTTSTGPAPDPFVLDSLPIRLTASGLSSQSQQQPPSNDKAVKPTEEPTTKKEEIPPPIPAKNRRRHDSAISITTPPTRMLSKTLASIPELTPISPLDMHLDDSAIFLPTCSTPSSPPAIPRKSAHRTRPSPLPLRVDELPSTPFTLWSHWQQGGIRLLRTGKARERLRLCSDALAPSRGDISGSVSPEDEMDLSVFQMAICVGENEPPADNENAVDELCGWVAELGVAVGGVVSEVEDARRRAAERLARRREERRVRAEEKARGRSLRRPVVEIDGREVEGRRAGKEVARDGPDADFADQESLPPSPMVDIRAGVPMGFNLGHDLDDYLKWERGVVERLIDE